MTRFWMALATAMLVCGPLRAADAPAESDSPSYMRHITALFSRLGCNGGTCHGAVQGKNGFRLSLFGADPALDHARLLRDAEGRRLNFLDPEASLLLLKATGQVAHEGGKRMSVGSSEYELLKRWITAGAPLDGVDPSRVVKVRVMPAEHTVPPGQKFSLKVEATFADGRTEDVTRYCSFDSLDGGVATVNANGLVETKGVGDTALIARYRAEPVMALVMVPRPSGEAFPEVAENNFVDRHILAKLRRLNIPPSALADDATFLRRACLDVTGELPTPDEVRAFLADTRNDKRARKIDQLLARPGYAALWTLKFCDLLKASDFGVYADGISETADAPRFQAWIRARIEENIPYDQFVERILTASSREGRSLEEWAREVTMLQDGYTTGRPDLAVYSSRKTLDLYWQRKASTGVTGALQVAHSFLGLRLECAQCHRHPHDVWQQDDLLSFANFFSRVRGSGFQGGNEKKYLDVAEYTKKLNDEAKKLGDEAKKMKDGRLKELDADAKKAKTELPKVQAEIARLDKEIDQLAAEEGNEEQIEELLYTQGQQKKLLERYQTAPAELDRLSKEMARMEKQSKSLPEIGRRMMHAEIQHLAADAPAWAKVTSPLGTQDSNHYRLLGETKNADIPQAQDPRQLLVEWLRRPDNPYFAKAMVNRVWAHYFGRGIIDPPDNLSSFNPASHPELLKELCDGFIASKFDLKWLHRTILNSRTCQQSSMATAANAVDRRNYAYFYYRRLPAEVLVDTINQATGTGENLDMKFNFWPEGMKTVEMPFKPKNEFINFMLEHFGKPARNSSSQCDCERDGSVSILQAMSLANHPRLWAKVADANGRVSGIIKKTTDENARIDELFLATVSRTPSDAERQACVKYLKEADSTEKGLQGVMWTLLNTREFLLQH